MRRLDVAEVLGFHETIMRGMGWSPASWRDGGGVESVVMRPRMDATSDDADLI